MADRSNNSDSFSPPSPRQLTNCQKMHIFLVRIAALQNSSSQHVANIHLSSARRLVHKLLLRHCNFIFHKLETKVSHQPNTFFPPIPNPSFLNISRLILITGTLVQNLLQLVHFSATCIILKCLGMNWQEVLLG